MTYVERVSSFLLLFFIDLKNWLKCLQKYYASFMTTVFFHPHWQSWRMWVQVHLQFVQIVFNKSLSSFLNFITNHLSDINNFFFQFFTNFKIFCSHFFSNCRFEKKKYKFFFLFFNINFEHLASSLHHNSPTSIIIFMSFFFCSSKIVSWSKLNTSFVVTQFSNTTIQS